jgi:hypothetical protein
MFDQNKYLIPKENIEYVRFETTYYSFDREVVPKYSPKLVMPYEFNDVEKELSKSIMRISVSKEKQ